jgi:TolC family type I secretion outer membrane protein
LGESVFRVRNLLYFPLAWLIVGSTAAAQDFYEALASTYQSNPTLLAARAELRAVNEGVPQELSNYRPFVSLDGEAGVQEIDRNEGDGSETTYPFEASVGLSQPIYRGGRTTADVARAEAEVQAQRAILRSVEQGVLLSAVIAYMDVWRDEDVVRLNINNEKVLARQLEATNDRFEVGELTRTDVAQSEARLSRAKAERIGAEGDLTGSQAVFAEIIGVPPVSVAPPGPVQGLPDNEADAISAALEDNPDISADVFAEKAAQDRVRSSIGELYPEVSLSAELRHAENEFSSDSETDEARVLAIVSIPLYQQGFVSSLVREDKQTANQLRIEIIETRRRIRQECTDAWEQLLTARAQILAFTDETRSAQIALEGVREENSVGQRTILDVLDAEQEFLDAQIQLTRAQRDETVAGFVVLQCLGRLTAADLALPVEVYDPDVDYQAVRNRWFGLTAPGE